MRNLIIVSILVGLIIITAFLFRQQLVNLPSRVSNSTTPTPTLTNNSQSPTPTDTYQIDSFNFQKQGHLIKGTAKHLSNNWYLSYETTGSPGLNILLNTNNSTVCQNCQIDKLTPGQLVEIKGDETNDGVTVKSIRLITTTSPSPTSNLQNTNKGDETEIDYDMAKSYVTNCQIIRIAQTQDKKIYLKHRDGQEFVSTQPKIDDIKKVVDTAKTSCKNIPIVTQ